jgi:hypothetical protein
MDDELYRTEKESVAAYFMALLLRSFQLKVEIHILNPFLVAQSIRTADGVRWS